MIQIVRRHWWFLWPFTVWLVFLAFAPVTAVIWFFDTIGIMDNLGWFFWVPALLWIGYWGIRAIFNWYKYQNDIWVITNQRIVDVFRSNPLNKRVVTADLVNIQDMRVERRGVIATTFGFGNVICSTAAGGSRMTTPCDGINTAGFAASTRSRLALTCSPIPPKPR